MQAWASPTLGSRLYTFCTLYVRTVRTIKYDWQAIQVLYTLWALGVWQWAETLLSMTCWLYMWIEFYKWQAMYVERSMKWGKRGLEEDNVTDLEERETNEEGQRRFVNLGPCLNLLSIHISVMTLHIDWLGEEQMTEIDVQSSMKS